MPRSTTWRRLDRPSAMTDIPTRTFTLEDQRAFAALSGDGNAIHVDPLRARRSLTGGPVVHGIHGLLWALDTWSARHGGPVALRAIDVSFVKPIPIDTEVSLVIADKEAGAAIELRLGSSVEIEGVV